MSKVLDLWDDLTGVILDYALSSPPSDQWLMCYGQALTSGVSATARLRSKLISDGSPYGDDGTGNPRVPDARGRVGAGSDSMGGSAAGRLTDAGSGVAGGTLGAVGGAQSVTLTADQSGVPSHGHAASSTHDLVAASAGAHNHTFTAYQSITGFNFAAAGPVNVGGGTTSMDGAHTHAMSGNISTSVANSTAADAAASHINVQPVIVLNKIIRL